MKLKRHVDAFLDNTQSSGSYYLGADSFDALTTGSLQKLASLQFRLRAGRLLLSRNADDRRAVSHINKVFHEDDLLYITAKQDGSGELQRPITQQTKIVRWLATASQKDISTFHKWNRERTQDLQLALGRDRPEIVGKAMEKTHELADIGLFPKFAPAVMEHAVNNHSLVAMDTFMSAGLYRVGFCSDHEVALANLYEDKLSLVGGSDELNRVPYHEYLHAAGNDRGFFRGLYTPLWVLRPLEEAFVEHATMVALTDEPKRPETIHPQARTDASGISGSYYQERRLLDSIVNHTDISIEQLGEAYFTPQGTERGDMIRADIERKIGNYFVSTQNFFAFVDKYEKSTLKKRDELITNAINQVEDGGGFRSDEPLYRKVWRPLSKLLVYS